MKSSGINSQNRKGRLPDFLIIGAAKCATTTLHRYLQRHSKLYMSDPKEPEFFSDDKVFSKGEAWYRSLFSQARDDQLCGEASTAYTRWPYSADSAARIAKMLPNVKLIYIMRNPVERAYSHYAHDMRKRIKMTFEEALDYNDYYVVNSRYLFQIKRYLEYYQRNSFLFLLFEDFKNNPAAILQKIQAFLGIPEENLCSEGLVYENITGVEYHIRIWTTNWLRELPILRQIRRMLSTETKLRFFEFIKSSFLGRAMQRNYQLQPMLPETKEKLIELFRLENEALGEFLGRDLSHWNR